MIADVVLAANVLTSEEPSVGRGIVVFLVVCVFIPACIAWVVGSHRKGK